MLDTLRVLLDLFKRKDVIGFTVLFLLGGALVGWFVLPQAWSPPMRLLAGLAMGFNGVIYVVAPRMIGGDDYDA